MFRDDGKEMSREEIEEMLTRNEQALDELTQKSSGIMADIKGTLEEVKNKIDAQEQAKSSSQGMFSSTKNKSTTPTEEESPKPKKGKGGCTIL